MDVLRAEDVEDRSWEVNRVCHSRNVAETVKVVMLPARWLPLARETVRN